MDLFECLGSFLKRLEIYTAIPPTPMMTNIIVKIMVELLSVLALATKQINQGRFSECPVTYMLPVAECAIEKFTKKLLGESEVEAVLMRLDRLTQEEARMTVAQTLGVVHGLVGNVRLVMEGAQCLHGWLVIFYWTLVRSDGKESTDSIRRDLGMCIRLSREIRVRLLTWGRSRSSRNAKRNEQDQTFVVTLLYLLLPKRTARFRCSVAKGRPTLAVPSGPVDEPRLCLERTP
jgi:hypothetical protein